MREIDLHVHTTESDGTKSPEEVVRLAKELGLRAIAITDHDTAAGYPAAAAEGARLGLEVVPGIEISTVFSGSVHILGYYIDPQSPEIAPVLEWVLKDRDERNRIIARRMASDGLPKRGGATTSRGISSRLSAPSGSSGALGACRCWPIPSSID